ncbi:MAG TPA: ABC transporter ATP-binding protein [Bryobacteraceae bacterium]|nr:ABC transporter ATP-binding protein [Bryobacteraceae bacterium]
MSIVLQTPMIICRQLTKQFGGFTAVKSLSFEVERGSICALLGPNGSGKSTTVKMITGLLASTSGDALVCGLPISANRQAIKKRIGVLPETVALFEDLTVEEHLALTGRVHGLDNQIIRARTDQLLHTLNLTGPRRTFASQCSQGTRKKTAFAMALLPNPEVLILDEPFEAIDPVTSKVMHDLLQMAARRGTTVLVTSHILAAMERIADRFIIIRSGEIFVNSTRADLPRPLEELYFDAFKVRSTEDLEWLGSGLS